MIGEKVYAFFYSEEQKQIVQQTIEPSERPSAYFKGHEFTEMKEIGHGHCFKDSTMVGIGGIHEVFQAAGIIDALEAVKAGHKVKLQEWEDYKFLFSSDGTMLERSTSGNITQVEKIIQPWKDRENWIIIHK